MYLTIICLFLVTIVLYLSFENFNLRGIVATEKKFDPNHENQQSLIEFLTQNKQRVEKDYSRSPGNFNASRYNVSGAIIGDTHAELSYQFPLIHGKVSQIKLELKPSTVSGLVDGFGVNSPYISGNSDGIQYVLPEKNTTEFDQFQTELKKGSWFINKQNKLSVDYKKLVQNHQVFCHEIAQHILRELQEHQLDSYFNRVQATLNFVQHIPYGLPCFDKNNFNYFGVALPPESFVLNYSDCDSKSIFFASILSHLVKSQNIVLVDCITSEPHMMVAVKGLNINTGRHVEFKGEDYLLLETTVPCVIGEWSWNNFELIEITNLVN